MRELLVKGLKELGIDYHTRQLDLLLLYIKEIEQGNALVNLVRATGEEMITNHLLDSLAGLKLLDRLWAEYCQKYTQKEADSSGSPSSPDFPEPVIADIGSGAGLPAIPLALFMPHARFILIENSPRKAGFLKSMSRRLNLPHLQVIEKDIRAVTRSFPLITFRAFTPLHKEIFRAVWNRLAPGGTLVAYKGKYDTLKEELKNFPEKNIRVDILPIRVPFLDKERHLLVMRRTNQSA
jgi:16S rRNA (guanine527-N7)-methyltransferase